MKTGCQKGEENGTPQRVGNRKTLVSFLLSLFPSFLSFLPSRPFSSFFRPVSYTLLIDTHRQADPERGYILPPSRFDKRSY